MKYLVERMWMVIGNTPVVADTLSNAMAKAETLPLPTETEALPDTARIIDAYLIN